MPSPSNGWKRRVADESGFSVANVDAVDVARDGAFDDFKIQRVHFFVQRCPGAV